MSVLHRRPVNSGRIGMSAGPVNITGAGCITAAGRNLREHTLPGVLERQRVIPVPSSLFETSLSCPVCAVCGNSFSEQAEAMVKASSLAPRPSSFNRTEKFFLTALFEAISCAGLSPEELGEMRVGIAAGTTVGSTFTDHYGYNAWKRGEAIKVDRVRDYFQGNLAALAHAVLGTSGPSAVIVNACSSGTDAIGLAAQWLRQDRCDICIAGGADELSVIPYHGFSSLQLLYEDACRPFDRYRAGLNLGEGAGCMVLEPSISSARSGHMAIGRILGYGAASDAWHPTAPHPQGRGLAAALKNALENAGLSVSDIHFVNAHGTGTIANDLAESRALYSVFGHTPLPVVSTKGITGHTLGAAGAVEAVLTLTTLGAGVTAGTAGCRTLDPELSFPVLTEGTQAELAGRTGISQSLAFGGGNSALVIEALTGIEWVSDR